MPSIKEVAKRAGVSIGTVSNVISGNTPVSPELRERVLAAIQELDYHPNHIARSLKVGQTNMVGMLIPDITNPVFPEMVRGAGDAAWERGYLLVTANTDDKVSREADVMSMLRSRCVDGMLLTAVPNQEPAPHIQNALDFGVPIVCIDRLPRGLAVDSVCVDNMRAAQDCVRHLIRIGHRDIAILTGLLSLDIGRDRLSGYEAALREAGLPVRKELILEGDFREETGYRFGKELLLAYERPTALFVSNGLMTVGVLQAMDETGTHCPQDLALATFDDLPFGRAYHPRLTAVAQPTYELGNQAAQLLIDRIERRLTGEPVSVRLKAELRIRESTSGRTEPLLTAEFPHREATGKP